MLKQSSGLEVEISRIDVTLRWPRPGSEWLWVSQGKDRRIISGMASGATVFVVRSDSGIISPNDFANTVFASPQLGNRHT
jgi:hypothetical protein